MTRYSLLSEAWIPVQRLDGKSDKVGLVQALTQAHNFRGVSDQSPLVSVALHRLCLAMIYCVYHPIRNAGDWERIWNKGRFDEEAIQAYAQKVADCFDLLDRKRPFYQVPYIEGEKVHPVAALLIEASSGNNPALFDHGRVEGEDWLPLDRAACYLLAHQWFAIGGGVSKPFNRMDAPIAKGFVVENIGRNLFETLMLNTIPLDRWAIPLNAHDAPFWEVENPPEPRKDGTPVLGPRHYLTWQSRRIHLVYSPEKHAVTGCQILQRYCLPKDGSPLDPGKAYYTDEEKSEGWQPRRLQKDRAAWRITHVLLQAADSESTRQNSLQPKVIAWLRALKRRESEGYAMARLPSEVTLSVSGLTTDPKLAAKVELWRREEIGLPTSIVSDDERIAFIESAISVAEKVEWHLRQTSVALAWAMLERNQLPAAIEYLFTGKTQKTRAKMPQGAPEVARGLGVTIRFWASMEGPFRELLYALAEEKERIEEMWVERLRTAARESFRPALNSLRMNGEAWEALSTIEDAFERRLAWVLRLVDEEESDEYERAADYAAH